MWLCSTYATFLTKLLCICLDNVSSAVVVGRYSDGKGTAYENITRYSIDTSGAETTTAYCLGFVSRCALLHFRDCASWGISFALRLENFSQYATQYLPRFSKRRREYETRASISYCHGAILPRVSFRLCFALWNMNQPQSGPFHFQNLKNARGIGQGAKAQS